jgi:hypothetical protein
MEALSGLDASLLYLETAKTPMHIGIKGGLPQSNSAY